MIVLHIDPDSFKLGIIVACWFVFVWGLVIGFLRRSRKGGE